MLRRFIAAVGMLALAVAYLPGAVGDLSTSTMPACCNGVMCPMHHSVDGRVVCDMVTNHPGSSLQSCPDNAQRYTAALAFIRVRPTVFFAERSDLSGLRR